MKHITYYLHGSCFFRIFAVEKEKDKIFTYQNSHFKIQNFSPRESRKSHIMLTKKQSFRLAKTFNLTLGLSCGLACEPQKALGGYAIAFIPVDIESILEPEDISQFCSAYGLTWYVRYDRLLKKVVAIALQNSIVNDNLPF